MSTGPGIRPSIHALPHSLIDQIAKYGRGRDGMIPLWFGEGDVPTPGFVMDAANQAMRDGHVFYTWQRGLPELRECLGRVSSADIWLEPWMSIGSPSPGRA